MDRNYGAELDALDGEQTDPAIGTSDTAQNLKNSPLFDQLRQWHAGLRERDRQKAILESAATAATQSATPEDPAPDISNVPLIRDEPNSTLYQNVISGRLTPEQQKAELENRLVSAPRDVETAQSELEKAQTALQNLNTRTQYDRSAEVQQAYDPTHDPNVEQQKLEATVKAASAELQSAQERKQLAEDQAAGKAPLPSMTEARNAAQRFATGAASFGTTLGKGVGVGAGYLAKLGASPASAPSTADPADNSVYKFSDYLQKSAESYFPGDPARQKEFLSKAASTLGFMAPAFLTGGLSASEAIPAALARSAKAVEVGGLMAGGAVPQFEAATAAMKSNNVFAGQPEEGMPAGAKPVSEADRALATAGGGALGLTGLVPIGRAVAGAGDSLAAGALQSGAVGAGQMAGYSVASDLLAKQFYDPDRKIGEGALQDGLVGFLASAATHGLAATFQGKTASEQERANFEKEVKKSGIQEPIGVDTDAGFDAQAARGNPFDRSAGDEARYNDYTANRGRLLSDQTGEQGKEPPAAASPATEAPKTPDGPGPKGRAVSLDEIRDILSQHTPGETAEQKLASLKQQVDGILNGGEPAAPAIEPHVTEASRALDELQASGEDPKTYFQNNPADPITQAVTEAFHGQAPEIAKERLDEFTQSYRQKEEAQKAAGQGTGVIGGGQQRSAPSSGAGSKEAGGPASAVNSGAEVGGGASSPGDGGQVRQPANASSGGQSATRTGRRGGADELQSKFADILASTKQRKEWGNELGISDRELGPLIEDAISKGLLRRDRNGVVRRTAAAKKAEPQFAINAYHGSPHDFDRFDINKIGTGEGAQAYGHGLYFAEHPEAAKNYATTLGDTYYINGEKADWNNPEHVDYIVANDYMAEYGDKKVALAAIRADRRAEAKGNTINYNTENAERIIKTDEYKNARKQGGVYQVHLDVEPEDLLDWDKPLSQQSPKVKNALEGLLPKDRALKVWEYRPNAFMVVDEHGRPLSAVADTYDSRAEAERAIKSTQPEDMTGMEITQRLAATKEVGGSKSASNVLAKAGIPGIRYLDEGSRTSGEGTRNYVLFDDKLVKITAKDGKPVSDSERQSVIDQTQPKGSEPQFAINAYHGSPHDFDRFDINKAGGGLNGSDFGHGINLTSLQAKAASYGQLYNVKFDADPNELLDWSKPFSDQPPAVQSAVSSLSARLGQPSDGGKILEGMLSDNGWNGSWDESLAKKYAKKYENELGSPQGYAIAQAREAYESLTPKAGAKGWQLYNNLAAKLGGKKAASDALSGLGVKGAAYTDDGGKSFTVFDDKLVKITAKDGKPVSDSERQSVIDQTQPKGSEPQFALSGKQNLPASEPRTPTEVKVYHGTAAAFDKFADGEIHMFSDNPEVANAYTKSQDLESQIMREQHSPDVNTWDRYSGLGQAPKVVPGFIETKNFKVLDSAKEPVDWHDFYALADKYKAEGYPGLVVKNVHDMTAKENVYITWTSGTVRSALSENQLYGLSGFHRGPEAAATLAGELKANGAIELPSPSLVSDIIERESSAHLVITNDGKIFDIASLHGRDGYGSAHAYLRDNLNTLARGGVEITGWNVADEKNPSVAARFRTITPEALRHLRAIAPKIGVKPKNLLVDPTLNKSGYYDIISADNAENMKFFKEKGWVSLPEKASELKLNKPNSDHVYALTGFQHGPEMAVEDFPQPKATPEQWRKVIEARPGWKDYADWTDLDSFLKDKKSISKEDLLSYMRAHSADLDEKVFGGSADRASDLDRLDRKIEQERQRVNGSEFDTHDDMMAAVDDLERLIRQRDKLAKSESDATKFEGHKIPGGKPGSYRELLIRDPSLGRRELTSEKQSRLAGIKRETDNLFEASANRDLTEEENRKLRDLSTESGRIKNEAAPKYTSKHFKDQEIASIRFDDRAGPNGEKTLFINEIQSDLDQTARKYGIGPEAAKRANVDRGDIENKTEKERKAAAKYMEAFGHEGAPNYPFKGDLWLELALKRALRYAVENRYDAISWARSDQIAKAVGADPADLAVQYDRKMGKFLDKYVKKWGAKVERGDVVGPEKFTGKTRNEIADRTLGQTGGDIGAAIDSLEAQLEDANGNFAARLKEAIESLSAAEEKEKNLSNPIIRITPQMSESVMGGQGQPYAQADELQHIADTVSRTIDAGEPFRVKPQTMFESHAIIRQYQREVPDGITVGAMTSVIPLNEGRSVRFNYRSPDGSEFFLDAIRANLFRGRAVFDQAKSVIGLMEFGRVRSPYELSKVVGGGIRHELVHVARATDRFSVSEWNSLLGHADNLDVLGWDQYDYSRLLGDSPDINLRGIATMRDRYEEAYGHLPDDIKSEFMDQEAVAHMVEVYHHLLNMPRNHPLVRRLMPEYRDVIPIIGDLFTGDIARRPANGADGPGNSAYAVSGSRQPQSPETRALTDLKSSLGLPLEQGRPKYIVEGTDKQPDGGPEWAKPKVEGHYDNSPETARNGLVTDIEAVAHDGGPRLEAMLGRDLAHLKAQYRGELEPLAKSYPGSAAPLSEGFREFFRNYVTDPETARAQAPEFYSDFSDLLDAHDPELLERLEHVQTIAERGDLQRDLKAPAEPFFRGAFGTSREKLFGAATRAVEDYKRALTGSDLVKKQGMDKANAYLASLPEDLRTYVLFNVERGFSNWHPVTRARDLGKILLGMQREIQGNELRDTAAKTKIYLGPVKAQELNGLLMHIAAVELHNTFSFMKTAGFAGRPEIDVRPTLDALKSAGQKVYGEFIHRADKARVHSWEDVKSSFQENSAGVNRRWNEAREANKIFGGKQPKIKSDIDIKPPRQNTGVDRSTRGFAKQFSRGWVKWLQPERFSERSLQADPRFAQYKAATAQEKDAIIAQGDESYKRWARVPEAEQLKYIDAVEKGAIAGLPEWQRKEAVRHRQLLDQAYKDEKEAGSKAEFVTEYMPHIWDNPKAAREVIQSLSSVENLGPKWFQEARYYDLIQQGLDHGLKLKTSNPEDLVSMRLLAGADMRQRMNLLSSLDEEYGLATKAKGAPPELVKQGWRAVNAPDKEQWLLAPDVQPLWENAVVAKGLWAHEGWQGQGFRGWMALKNIWTPIKLALSLFHPLHVLHINQSEQMARAWVQATHGDFYDAAKSLTKTLNLYPKIGREARSAWIKPEDERTPSEKVLVNLMTEGGFSPQLSEQLKIAAGRQFQKALAEHSPWTPFIGLKRGLEKTQGVIFEKWIPNLKAAAYINDAAAFAKRSPEKFNDPIQRKAGLRAIGKSIDNRYGEMFYGSLFWNRTLKDAGIGSFLSLGWNLGFGREFGGGLLSPIMQAAEKATGKDSGETRETIRDAQNKTAFVLSYVTSAMLLSGLMTYMLTGEQPDELTDFIFPRVGGRNPDGSPRRLTTMFYTREVPMLMKHIQEEGGGIHGTVSGSANMLYNKLLFQPFVEMFDNRDYFGRDIVDVNAPEYKQAYQFAKHVLLDQFSPITFSGAHRALETGGTSEKDVPLAFLGFGPAPAYASRTATQNRISYLYNLHIAPYSKPEPQTESDEAKRDAKQAFKLAQVNKDEAGMEAARTMLAAAGTKAPKLPGDVAMFKMLRPDDQIAIVRSAPDAEAKRYLPYVNKKIRNDETIAAIRQGGAAQVPVQQQQSKQSLYLK